MTEHSKDPFDLSGPDTTPVLTVAEERILRGTIDDPMIFDIPKRTVKRLLALVDSMRTDTRETDRIVAATNRMRVAHGPNQVTFVTQPADSNRFAVRLIFDGALDERIVTRGECVHWFRLTHTSRVFELPNGAFRAGAELADLIERGLLP